MLKKWSTLFAVLRAGRRFKNPVALKNVTVLSGLIFAFINPVLAALEAWTGVKIDITQAETEQASEALATIVNGFYGLFIVYATISTTNKIGLPGLGRADSGRGK